MQRLFFPCMKERDKRGSALRVEKKVELTIIFEKGIQEMFQCFNNISYTFIGRTI